jgi:release factor glutamine methyltransferase
MARLWFGPHPDHARQDAETLLLHVIGKNRAWLLAHADEELPEGQASCYTAFLERRYKGEPIQYIIGEQEFYGLPFLVAPSVLIPRPETEHVVEKVVQLAPLFPRPRIVDVGTGSGAIAIAVAHEWPSAAITAVDISAAALELARRNAERIGFADRIRFFQADLLGPVRDERFDIVVSNPPYVPLVDRALLSVEVREHEPAVALFAGEDGLDVYRKLIPAAFVVLEPGGFLVMEIGYGQSGAVAALMEEAGFEPMEFVPDLQGIPRVACGQRARASGDESGVAPLAVFRLADPHVVVEDNQSHDSKNHCQQRQGRPKRIP